MSELPIYNIQGEMVGKRQLNESIFGLKIKPEFIHQIVVAMQANARHVIAHTKTRGEVRGGGRKPWAQKHTGRARHGSIRSPIWKGGGVVFGPRKERNYKQKINKKVKRKALLMSLSDKATHQKIIFLDNLDLPQIKTKEAMGILYNLKLKQKKEAKVKVTKKSETGKIKDALGTKKTSQSILIVLPGKSENVEKSFRNISKVKPIHVNNINLLDILKYQYLMMPIATVEKIETLYGK